MHQNLVASLLFLTLTHFSLAVLARRTQQQKLEPHRPRLGARSDQPISVSALVDLRQSRALWAAHTSTSTTAMPSLLALLSGSNAGITIADYDSVAEASTAQTDSDLSFTPFASPATDFNHLIDFPDQQDEISSSSSAKQLSQQYQMQINALRSRIERAVAQRLCHPSADDIAYSNIMARRALLSSRAALSFTANRHDGWYVADSASGCATFAFCPYIEREAESASLYACPPGMLFQVDLPSGIGGSCERAEYVRCDQMRPEIPLSPVVSQQPSKTSLFFPPPSPSSNYLQPRIGQWSPLQERVGNSPTGFWHITSFDNDPSTTTTTSAPPNTVNMQKLIEHLKLVDFFEPLYKAQQKAIQKPLSIQLPKPDVQFVAINGLPGVVDDGKSEDEPRTISSTVRSTSTQQNQAQPSRTVGETRARPQQNVSRPNAAAPAQRRPTSPRQRPASRPRQPPSVTSTTQRAVSRSTTTTTLAPVINFRCPDQLRGFFVAPNTNCSKYFFCDSASEPPNDRLEFDCPQGLLFNSAVGSCDLPQNSECSQFVLSQSSTDESSGRFDPSSFDPKIRRGSDSTAILPGSPVGRSWASSSGRRPVGGTWRTQLPQAPGLGSLAQDDCPFPIPGMYPIDKCQAFVQCTYDLRAFYVKCPQQLLFNERLQTCDWFYNVRCNKGGAVIDILPDDVVQQLNIAEFTRRREEQRLLEQVRQQQQRPEIGSFNSSDGFNSNFILATAVTTPARSFGIAATTARAVRRRKPKTKAELDAEAATEAIQTYGFQLCRGRRVGFYGDPIECSRYWFCPASGESAYSLSCPRGERYSEKTGACDASLGINCAVASDGSARANFLANANYAANNGNEDMMAETDSAFDCTGKNGWYADDEDPDCKGVFFCNAGVRYRYSCRGATRFNSRIARCDAPVNVLCGGPDAASPESESENQMSRTSDANRQILFGESAKNVKPPFGWSRFGVNSVNASADIGKQTALLLKLEAQNREQLRFANDYDCGGKEGYFALRDTNCRQFIFCADGGEAFRFECPGTLQFNNSIALCDWQVQCDQQGDEDESDKSNFEFSCRDKIPGFYGHQSHSRSMRVAEEQLSSLITNDNSRQFYYCDNNRRRYIYSCPATLIFNQTQNVCDWPTVPSSLLTAGMSSAVHQPQQSTTNLRPPTRQNQGQRNGISPASVRSNGGAVREQDRGRQPTSPQKRLEPRPQQRMTTPTTTTTIPDDVNDYNEDYPAEVTEMPTDEQLPEEQLPPREQQNKQKAPTEDSHHQDKMPREHEPPVDWTDCTSRAPGYYAHPTDPTRFGHCASQQQQKIIPMKCPHTGDFDTMFSQKLGQCVFEWQLPAPEPVKKNETSVTLAQIVALRASSTAQNPQRANTTLLTYLNFDPEDNTTDFSINNIQRRPMDRAVWLNITAPNATVASSRREMRAQAMKICGGLQSMLSKQPGEKVVFSDWSSSCKRYLECSAGGRTDIKTCAGENDIFDYKQQKCLDQKTAQCFPADTAGGITVKMQQCEEFPGAWLTDPLSQCTTFYSCDLSGNGEAIKFSCPQEMMFNWHIGACDSKMNKTEVCNTPLEGGMIHVTFSKPVPITSPPVAVPARSASQPLQQRPQHQHSMHLLPPPNVVTAIAAAAAASAHASSGSSSTLPEAVQLKIIE